MCRPSIEQRKVSKKQPLGRHKRPCECHLFEGLVCLSRLNCWSNVNKRILLISIKEVIEISFVRCT